MKERKRCPYYEMFFNLPFDTYESMSFLLYIWIYMGIAELNIAQILRTLCASPPPLRTPRSAENKSLPRIHHATLMRSAQRTRRYRVGSVVSHHFALSGLQVLDHIPLLALQMDRGSKGENAERKRDCRGKRHRWWRIGRGSGWQW